MCFFFFANKIGYRENKFRLIVFVFLGRLKYYFLAWQSSTSGQSQDQSQVKPQPVVRKGAHCQSGELLRSEHFCVTP